MMKPSGLLIVGIFFVLVIGVVSIKPAEAKPHVPIPFETYSRTMKIVDCAIYNPSNPQVESIRCNSASSVNTVFTENKALAWIKYLNHGSGPNTVNACLSVGGAKISPATCQTNMDGKNVSNGKFDWGINFKSKGQHKGTFAVTGPDNYKQTISFSIYSK